MITTIIIIVMSIVNGVSQDLSGASHGTAKTPDDKEVLFVSLFEKNENHLITTMAAPSFHVSGIKPKLTTLREGSARLNLNLKRRLGPQKK